MKDLNTGAPPTLRPTDFPDEISYDEWKREESKAISELMVSMIESNPLLAKSEPTEVLSSLLSDPVEKPELRRTISDTPFIMGSKHATDVEQLSVAMNGKPYRPDGLRRMSLHEEQDEFVPKTTYTFIPEEPRAYCRRLIELCLKTPKNEEHGDEAEESLLSNATMALLNECAVRWRVHPAARVSLLLDVVRQLYDNEELGIRDLNDAFSIADYWNYQAWPNTDVNAPYPWLIHQRLLFVRTLISMHETLLRDLYNILQRVFDPKPLNPKPILVILDQYIYSNPMFKETEPDLTNYIAELELGIKVNSSIRSSLILELCNRGV
jgi:hypothetical protein